MIPSSRTHLYPVDAEGLSVIHPDERETLPIVLQLNHEVTVHTTRLALLAHESRVGQSLETADDRQRKTTAEHHPHRVLDIRQRLQELWTNLAVQKLSRMHLPARAQRLFDHTITLYQASVIYSYTSMWPNQGVCVYPDHEGSITTASEQILHVSQSIVANNPGSCRFLIFPLFMAGFASKSDGQKTLALNLLRQIEAERPGQNTWVISRALGIIYTEQSGRCVQTGNSTSIDWLQSMVQHGLTVVNFGP